MTVAPTGVALVKSFESCRFTAYRDQAGRWTLGWGRTLGIVGGMVCTQAQADAWLLEDLGVAEAAVNRLVKVPLTQGQFDALVDFTFNLGEGSLWESTLLRLVNARDYAGAAEQFPRWNLVGGEISPGLVRRRQAEQELFLAPEE